MNKNNNKFFKILMIIEIIDVKIYKQLYNLYTEFHL